ncbi:MAG: translocation/assembly module TamB [Bacteroidales bacterium]|nr:translocation/assembly module TamB [Bacteroidales bacterium]
MLRSIKRSIKYFIIVIGIIIAIPTILSFVLRIPEVQTLLVKRITNHFSEEFQSVISVGKIHFSFFNKLNINDILIKDKNDDTLIYSQFLSAGIRRINFKNKKVSLGKVIMIKPFVALITDTSGVLNLSWYLDLIRTPEDTLKKTESDFSINQIELSDARFSLINKSGIKSSTPINFNNLRLNDLNAIVEEFEVYRDTTSFSIYNLGFRESSGFAVNRMSSDVIITKSDILFNSALLLCDSTVLNISHFGLHADSSASFRNFIKEIKIDLVLNKSLVSSSDLQYFVSPVKGIEESAWLSGRVFGTVSELRGRNIQLSYSDETYLDCDFDFSGLPEIGNTFIYLGINNLNINLKDIEKIKIPGKNPVKWPEILYKLGNISFDGSFTGFTTDFVTYGKIRTDIGTLSTDISLRPEETSGFRINGLITGSSIALGKITGRSDLFGNISMKTDIDGYSYALKNFSGNLTGRIDSIEINNYKYRNIALSGIFKEKTWDGSIKIADENIKLDLLGMLNFSKEMPEFDFTMNLAEADLNKLNFDKTDTTSNLSMLMTANIKGSNIDNLDGEIKLLNSSIRKYGKILEFYDMSLRTFTENDLPAMSLRTDFVDADLRGNYNFAQLRTSFKSILASLMPSRFSVPVQENEAKKNSFTFNIAFKNTDKINNFFRSGILLSEKSAINGAVFPDSIISISGKAGTFSFGNNMLKDITVDAKVILPEFSFDMKSSSLNLLGQSELKGFSVNLNTVPDKFVFTVNWDNKDKILNSGNFIARGNFLQNTSGKGNPILTINIDSTNIYSRNNLWKVSNSSVLFDTSSVKINNLFISSKERYYLVDGNISEDTGDTLHLEFKGIDLSPLNYIINRNNDPDMFSLSLKGVLNGNLFLTDVYRNILLESDVKVNNFSILESELGDLSIISAWDNKKKVANINAGNNLAGKKMIDIAGSYDPVTKMINLNASADKLPVDALNPLLNIFASGITGSATGKVNLSGEIRGLVLKGALLAENASMKIDYLQTKYRLNDSIRFDKNEIRFKNIRLTDEKGNIANLNGSVYHKYFKDFTADLMININECMVLNTKPKDNELFYGTAYGSGVTTIKSTLDLLSFDISAKTGRNTKIYIPLNTSETVSDYSYITFINPDTTVKTEESTVNEIPAPATETGMEINFDLEVTPEAEIQLIFDPKVGDVIKGHGSGNLNINLDRNGDLRISGDYIIEDGDYLFTLGNIFNKHFSVENGGKITFRGDIDNAEIDMKAIYKLKTSLAEILPGEAGNERIPIECQLNLSGKLFNPVIGLNIDLPQADEQTRSILKSAITTEEELSRQFLYLLVMNQFYSDVSSMYSLKTSPTTTTTEMLSNQLSNWLSQISNDFDVGFVYRPGYNNPNSQEVQVALSTQLLNDKVTINGNFDVRAQGSAANHTYQIPDVDIEYKIAEKIRFKVFNRFNSLYTGSGIKGDYTQGFGFFFQQDFDKFSDLFRKREKSEMKKEDNPTITEN